MNVKDVKQIRNIINQNITYWSNSLIFIIYPYMFFILCSLFSSILPALLLPYASAQAPNLAGYTYPHDGASVLACVYQLKVRSQNPKDFEHGFSQRLWVKFAIFLLNSTSVDACAIYGGAQNINFIWLRFLLFSLTTLVCLFLDRYKHASGNACYLGGIRIC